MSNTVITAPEVLAGDVVRFKPLGFKSPRTMIVEKVLDETSSSGRVYRVLVGHFGHLDAIGTVSQGNRRYMTLFADRSVTLMRRVA